jgi:hypothetical protein
MGPEGGLAAAEVMDRIRGSEASFWLAHLAVSSPWEPVRSRAVAGLKTRSLAEFVPGLLAAMRAPVEVARQSTLRPDGSVAVRQTLLRETQETIEQSVGEVTYWAAAGLPDWDPAGQLASWENDRSDKMNRRIADVLNQVTDQALSSAATAWWSWWDKYNELRKDPKPVVSLHTKEVGVPAPPPRESLALREEPRLMGRGMRSCFAAGTCVWTVDGPQDIQRIAIGDLVLSQNVETGELAYKPVLRTTEASPVALVAVRAGEDVLCCTGGHAFWVPGRGWVQARKIELPSRIHGLSGAVEVKAVAPAPARKTYNLVVTDFNTYFVGEEKFLVHDVTFPGPTTAGLPGLKAH